MATVRAGGREFKVSDNATQQQIATKIDEFFTQERRRNITVQQQTEFNPAEGVGAGGAFAIGAGAGLTNVGRGAQRLLLQAFGTPEEQEAAKQAGVFSEQALAPLREEQPVATFLGEITGESAALPIGGIGTGAARLGTAALTGALAGGLSTAGRGGEASDIALTSAIGGALGPVGEAVGALVGRLGPQAAVGIRNLIRRATGADAPASFFTASGQPTREALEAIDQLNITADDFREAFSGPLSQISDTQGLPAEQAFRASRAAEQGVSLTRGQSSRDFAQQEAEQTLKNLATEEGAQARLFFDAQQADLVSAKNRFVENIGGAIDATREGRGEALKTSLRELNQAEKETVRQLYTDLAELPGGDVRLNGSPLVDLKEELVREIVPSDRITKGLDNILNDFAISPDFDDATATFQGPLTFKNAEKLRKRLNRLNPSDPADVAVIATMKDNFDNLIGAATEQFPENSDIAGAAKAARDAAAARFDKFQAKDIIQDLIDFKKGTKTDRVADSQVFDKVFQGTKKIENIKRVKRILLSNGTPESKQAWKSIQAQGMLDILGKAVTETPDGFVISGAKLNSAVKRFGDDAIKQLLDPAQLKAFKALQGTIGDSTIPVSGTTNPSGTAAKIMNTLHRLGVSSHGGLVDKAASLTGAGVGAIKEASRRQDVLTGIQRGAKPQQSMNAILRLAAQLETQRAGTKELSDDE